MNKALYKYFSSFFRNIILFYLTIYVRRYILFPHSAIQYIYVIPFGLIFYSTIDFISSPAAEDKELSDTSFYLLLFSGAALLLSPFMHWWFLFPENAVFFFSFLGFLIVCSLFLFNFSWVIKFFAEKNNSATFLAVAKFARLFTLYCLVAPLIAFAVSSVYGQSRGDDVYLYLMNLSPLKKFAMFMPVFLLCGLADIAKFKLEKQGLDK